MNSLKPTAPQGLVLVVGIFVLIGVLGVIPGTVLAQDVGEPNDDPANATSVETNTQVNAALATNDYTDYYNFTVNLSDNATVEFTNHATSQSSTMSVTLNDVNGEFVDLATVEAGQTVDIGNIFGQNGTASLEVFDTTPARYSFKINTAGQRQSSAGSSSNGTSTSIGTPSGELPPPHIDTSNLATYTNPVFGYSIDHPANWTVDTTDPTDVPIDSIQHNSELEITTTATPRTYSLAEANRLYTQRFKENLPEFEKLGEHRVTLESGQQALLVDATYDSPSDTAGAVRSKFLLISTNKRVFIAELVYEQSQFTDQLNQSSATILKTFNLGSNGTMTTSTTSGTQTTTQPQPQTTTQSQAPTSTQTHSAGNATTSTETSSGGNASTRTVSGANGSDENASSGNGSSGGGSSTFGPGFGPVVTFIALLMASFLVIRYAG